MSQAIALFGLKVKPGDVHRMDVTRDFRIANVSFGEEVKGNARTVVKVHLIPSYGHPMTEEGDEDSDEEDDDDDEEAPAKQYEERSFVLCTLTPGKVSTSACIHPALGRSTLT